MSNSTPSPISYDIWVDTYQPIKNTIDSNASYDGLMFETFGAEEKFVRQFAAAAPCRVWTLIDGDDGRPVIVSGLFYVNRLGYFITEQPWPEDADIEVVDECDDGLD